MPSKSKSQQRLMGVAYAVKSGDMQLSDVDTNYKDKVKDLVDGMTLKQLKDFAETKHDGLPEVKEGISPANIGGMGPIQLPTDSQPGSGDVPAGTKSEDDEEDEKELKENMKGLITSFESFVQEARDLNDPVAMKMRAAMAKGNAKKDEPKKPEVSPAKAKKVAQLKAKRAQLMRDMEQEAEPSGGPITDRYGAAIDKIDKQIAKLSGKKEKGYKLTEAYNEDDINMSYGFFGTITDTAKSEKEALKLFDEGVAQLQRAPYRLTEEEALAVLNSKMGRKAADQINDGQADSAVLGLEQYYGKKLKSEIAKVQRAAVSESTEVINEWGGSDQYAMNQSIHRDMRKPKTMPSPFDKRLRSIAADAVDFYWDDWEEYKSDYEGLVDNAVRSYLRAMFPKEFNMMVRMFEPVDESLVLENMFDGVKSLADELNAEIYKATLKNGAKTATINATTTTKTWDDGAPVLKYLARGKAKKMSFDFYYRPFTVLHDVAHGWFYFTDGRKWYGLHSDEGYFEPEDLPFDLRVVDSVDEALVNEGRSINKIQKDWGKVTADMKSTVEAWKAAEGKEKEDLLATLKDLTSQKKKLEAELDAAVGLKDIDAELVESLDEAKAWDKLNKIADKKYGEFGFATLDDDQMSRNIDIEAANKLAEERYGEFGFATLSEDEMESLINNNPKLVK